MATYPQASRLAVTVGVKDGKSLPTDLYMTPPLKIMRPFYQPDGCMELMLMSSSAGLMEGDRQEQDWRFTGASYTRVTSQSFEKVHRMPGGGRADRSIKLDLAPGSKVIFTPLPLIPFAESETEQQIQVHLADRSSGLILSDSFTAGRVGRNECFAFRHYRSEIEVYCGAELVYLDRSDYRPATMDYRALGFFEGLTHTGTLAAFHLQDSRLALDLARRTLKEEETGSGGKVKAGASLTWRGDLVVRMLAGTAQAVTRVTTALITNLKDLVG